MRITHFFNFTAGIKAPRLNYKYLASILSLKFYFLNLKFYIYMIYI